MIVTSGSGVLIDRCLKFIFLKKSLHLIASDKACKAEDVATKNNINYENLDERDSKKLNERLLALAINNKIEFIISYSFTRKITGEIFKIYENRLFNSHFSILPGFKGYYDTRDKDRSIPARKIFERMINYGARVMGNTVHILTEEIDAGAPVIVSSTNVPYDENTQYTRHRLFIQECKCLVQLVDWLNNDRIYFIDGKPIVKNAKFEKLGFSPNLDNADIAKFTLPFPY